MRRSPNRNKHRAVPGTRGVDFGWRVHAAIQDWTRAVDQKASITLVLTVGLATLAGREVFVPTGGLSHAAGAQLWVIRGMGLGYAVAALLAISVVLPSLKGRQAKATASSGLIYFGHLRHRDVDDIAQALRRMSLGGELDQLALQVKVTSGIAWRKHRRLQLAISALVVASALFVVARLVL